MRASSLLVAFVTALQGASVGARALAQASPTAPAATPCKWSKLQAAAQAGHGARDLAGCDLSAIMIRFPGTKELDLRGANLAGDQIDFSHLEGANLDGANLAAAALANSHLEGASLRGANLRRASFSNVQLKGVDLTDADLREARLGNTNFRETRGLTQRALVGACGDPDIAEKLPAGLHVNVCASFGPSPSSSDARPNPLFAFAPWLWIVGALASGFALPLFGASVLLALYGAAAWRRTKRLAAIVPAATGVMTWLLARDSGNMAPLYIGAWVGGMSLFGLAVLVRTRQRTQASAAESTRSS